MTRAAGFTLLELLIAVAIFALVGAMAYGGLQRVLDVCERVSKNVPEIQVSALLRSMVKDGRKFADLEPQALKV